MRSFVSGALRALLCGWLAFGAGAVPAQPVAYAEGMHYTSLATPLPDADPDRIEVLELFWYGCPDCYDLLPTLQLWEASYRTTDMNFGRVPVVWNAAMETHAHLYLTAEALGLMPAANKSAWHVTPTAHNAIFDALHAAGRPLRTAEEGAELFAELGVAKADFDAAWHSAPVMTRLEELKGFPVVAELPSLPALLVDGRYLIAFNEGVRTSDDLFKVLSFLVVKIREERRRGNR